MEERKQAYKEIRDVCIKHKELGVELSIPEIRYLLEEIEKRLLFIEWKEKYNIRLSDSRRISSDYIRVSDHLVFYAYKDANLAAQEGQGRYISWSDNNEQPTDGWYLVLSFSTGAYIFGDDYDAQKSLFKEFFNELKSYNPDYSDTVNKSLYFRIENSSEIYNEFNNILKKYAEKNKAEINERKIEKLKMELEALTSK